MASSDDTTSTMREAVTSRPGRGETPVLLVGSCIPGASRVVSLARPVTIGRGHKSASGVRNLHADVILHSDSTLSRAHLRIAGGARGSWQVEDLGGPNGTFVDGWPAKPAAPLAVGSIVQFGRYVGVFRRVSPDQRAAIATEAEDPLGPVATQSPALALTLAGLRRLAAARTDLLFLGETGAGKEIYARAVHAASGRAGPFVAVNCGALPVELVESELYGYARGAHSTATRAKPGLVEAADGGTLLLDEVGDMPAPAQVKLLRFLQDRQVLPLGSTRPRPVDVRVLAATSRPRELLRPDLVGRLGAEPIVIPPLRDRVEDVGALVAHFGGAAAARMEAPAFRALCLYHWPRNVRELAEAMKRAAAVAGERDIRLEDLPEDVRGTLDGGGRAGVPNRHRAAPSRLELERLLGEHGGNLSSVARALDRQWNVVHRWVERYGLGDRFRK
jgi:transcriptional regulator with PAS, ATPase and Fis domain